MDEIKKDEVVEVPAKFAKIVEEIEKMSVLDLNELVKVFEKKFGVSATAVAAAGPLSVEIGPGGNLPVDAPDITGLGMDQHLAAGVPGRIEEEAPFMRKGQLGADVADQEQVGVRMPGEPHPEEVTDR